MDELFASETSVRDADRAALIEAIRHAYPQIEFLYLRLEQKWIAGFRAGDYFDLHRGTIPIIADIVKHADASGKVLELLGVMWSDKPQNPQLLALADKFFPSKEDKAAVIAKYAPPPATPPLAALKPSLEKLVEKRSKLLRLSTFINGMEQLSGALCRISLKRSAEFEPSGTGFLVGRRHVLTNYHVMEDAIGKLDGDRILLEFDFSEQGAATTKVDAASGTSWHIASSRYSLSDLSGTGTPSADELDYCLVRLADDVPAERLHLAWPSAPPIVSQRDFIAIGQHPQGEEANVAFGEVLAYPGSGLRYRYDVTTEPGSSGSPVLTLDLNLVALHHAGDPELSPEYNQGVPIWLIMDALKAKNIDVNGL